MISQATRALGQEALDRSFLQRLRSHIRHGLNGPLPTRNLLSDFRDDPPVTTTPVTTTPNIPVVAPPVAQAPAATVIGRVRNRIPSWAKVALATAIAGPIGAAAVALGHYLGRDDSPQPQPNPPVVVQPAPPTIIQPTTPSGGDLLDWLEKEGHNR